MPTVDEKRKSVTNKESDIFEARVIANYGDPGLQEDFAFDILSRYLIVAIEPSSRVPTTNKWHEMLAIVARPRPLWIDADGGRANSYTSQRRSDYFGNISAGAAGSFSTDGIPPIDKPYRMGETIKIKRLPNSLKFSNTDGSRNEIFQSVFSISDGQGYYFYNDWHNEGAMLPYFIGQQSRIDPLRYQTIFNPNFSEPFSYAMTLYKYQYEAFLLTLIQNEPLLTAYVQKMFANENPSTNAEYSAHGGYLFKENTYTNFFSVDFEDLNIDNKQRTSVNECLPTIVTSPFSFPTPRVREIGTINYSPTYSTIVKNN